MLFTAQFVASACESNLTSVFLNRNDVNLNWIDFSPDYCRMSRPPPLASPENEHEDDFGKMHTVCVKLSKIGNVLFWVKL